MDASDRRKRAAEEAAEWWVLLQSEVSRTQREQYVEWLRESAVHVAEMLRVAQIHGALAQFERWGNVPTDGSNDASGSVVSLLAGPPLHPESPPPSRPKQPARRLRLVSALAASLLAVAVAAGLFFYLLQGQVIQTERGERREVALADGSVVQVDPETRLRVVYEPQVRRIYLERGRALFHVAKNAQRPFLVRAEDTTVRAVGTAFAVEQGQGSVVVTVAEGKVAVLPARAVDAATFEASGTAQGSAQLHDAASSGAALRAPAAQTLKSAAAAGGLQEIVLIANEQVRVAGSGAAEPVREVDSHRALAWAEGRLVFEDDTVEYAVRQFNRYNRIQLSVNDAVLAHRTISGVFSAADPGSFVAFIHSVAAVRVTTDDASDITIDTAN
jgi:transmembrane sensor